MKNMRKGNSKFSLLAGVFALSCLVTIVTLFCLNPKKAEEEPAQPTESVVASQTLDEKVAEKIANMTIDEKIGQLIFARVPAENALRELNKYHFGGYILFGRDVENETLASVRMKVDGWQNASATPMFIGIDEEGGIVSRLSYAGLVKPVFKSPQELFNEGGMDLVLSEESRKINVLKRIGVNVNFSPVADTCTDENSFIYERTFGKDAAATAEYIASLVSVYENSGVSATLKHFPGYGNNLDTHSGIAIDERTLDSFRTSDFLPFTAGIGAGANFVMVSHNIVKNIDAENPASISPEMHRILREELDFDGIIITDDLAMDAIAEFYRGEQPAAVQAVLAGNNMLIVSDYATAFDQIKAACMNGVLSEKDIEKLIAPVIKLKIQ